MANEMESEHNIQNDLTRDSDLNGNAHIGVHDTKNQAVGTVFFILPLKGRNLSDMHLVRD